MDRRAALDQLANSPQPFDLLVVGGGATGLGAALDAAARGHRVALVEQDDFAKGTSSRSTKLVHGGVRYLRQGNISLVQEALRERGLLYQNAPHLVRNMAFVIPNYKWWEGPFYGIGMKVYDGLAGRLGLSPSRYLTREETLAAIPTIETEGLTGGVVYHDGQFDDSRLAIDLAQTAAAHGAAIANYLRCVALLKKNGKVAGITALDAESGQTFDIHARVVLNATGVFADSLRTQDDPAASPIVAVSQGVHLVLPQRFLPGQAAIMVPKTADGRVLFAVPWHGRVVLGTTDTPRPASSLEPRALAEERAFLMSHAARYLSQDPRPEDVLSIYAGLRPLVKAGNGADTATLSRDHSILISPSGLVSVVGGKWTTYRKMAQDVVDQVELAADLPQRPCPTANLPIHGAQTTPDHDAPLAHYGAAAPAIAAIIKADPTLSTPLHPDLPYLEAEVIHHARHEMARTVEDVLARRTRALLLDARASQQAATRVAALLAQELHRPPAWAAAQATAYQTLAAGYDFLSPASSSPQK